MAYPKFGASGGFTRSSRTERSDQAELVIGRTTEVFVRSKTGECSATTSDCSWGINPDGNIIFDSARITIEDEPDTNFTGIQVGDIDPLLPLVAVKCCVVKRAKVTLSLEGKGDPGFVLGSTTIPSLTTAIGVYSIVPPAGVTLRAISYALNETDQDWQKFTVEFQGYIPQPDNTSTGSLASAFIEGHMPPNCVCPDNKDCCTTYRVEKSLNGAGYAEMTVSLTMNPLAA